MPDNTNGFAGRLPDGLFPDFLTPYFDDAWSIAVAGFVLAMWVYLIGYWLAVLIDGNFGGFRGFLSELFGGGLGGLHRFPVIAPALLLAVALVVLAMATRPAGASSPRARMLRDAALLGASLMAAVQVVGNLIGFIVDLSFINDGFARFVEEAAIHVGALIVAAGAGLWAMSVLNSTRPAAPNGPSPSGPPGSPPN
jgi:uncharacterized RDD family membrane protein YckC